MADTPQNKYKFGLWSPHRDSNSVRAFKVTLGLRPEPWTWYQEASQASWWVTDGTRGVSAELSEALRQAQKKALTHGLVLAPDWSAVKDPVWAFFKVPVQASVIYRWIDTCLQKFPSSSDLSGQQLRLRQWPNLSLYTTNGNRAASVKLTLACSQLLKDWMRYEDFLAICPDAAATDALLADALRDGILNLTAATPLSTASAVAAPDVRGWALVKKLIGKFT